MRAAGGIRILINLLSPRACPPATGPDLRAVAVSCLLGLARDPSLCSILSRLQVPAHMRPGQADKSYACCAHPIVVCLRKFTHHPLALLQAALPFAWQCQFHIIDRIANKAKSLHL